MKLCQSGVDLTLRYIYLFISPKQKMTLHNGSISYWAHVAVGARGYCLVWTAWCLGPIPRQTPLQIERCSSDPNEQTPPVGMGAVLEGI